ncbi:MAG: hypothetical protein OQK76_13470 [Gammaproteobacteria bacterium]|nr:hypothetical protein [Gammaproteobacteria bacterium]MCW8911617.1 hypothetical protein [Gammaproteobacteria bacterium]MCW9005445.1 hypothetical protein [Gammaproteobacteria bacterium]
MNSELLGKWRIIDSEEWAPDMLNMDGDAYIEIEKDGFGFINFCAVEVDLDYRCSKKDDNKIYFSFSGNDDNDPVSGRGWAKLHGNKLKAQIYFHRGMESWLNAEK